MLQNTLKATLQETLWNRDLDRQNSYIAAEEKARAFALAVHVVSGRYAFAPAHDLFRFTAQGVCTQAAMTLTEEGSSLTVICKVDDAGDALWLITDASRLHFAAAVYIAAVKARLENNRRAD